MSISTDEYIQQVIKDTTYINTIINLGLPLEQKHAIILGAVNGNCNVIKHIDAEHMTIDICTAAVKQDGLLLYFCEGYLADEHYNQFSNYYELLFEAVKQNPNAVEHIPWSNATSDQINSICLEAVTKNGLVLQYIEKGLNDEGYADLVLVAVKQNWRAIKLIYWLDIDDDQSYSICLEAVSKNGLALEYCNEQIDKEKYITLALTAVKNNSDALKYAIHQTYEMQLLAVQNNGYTIEFVEYQTPELCLEAVKRDGCAICLVEVHTEDLCLAAVKENGYALENCKIKTLEICFAAVQSQSVAIRCVPKQMLTSVMIMDAVCQDGYNLRHIEVDEQTEQVCLAAVKQNGLALQFVKKQTPAICIAAIKQNGIAIRYNKLDLDLVYRSEQRTNDEIIKNLMDQNKEIFRMFTELNAKYERLSDILDPTIYI